MAERLPLVEKLPLAIRKSLRDKYESKKEELEQTYSDILGVPWTITCDPNQIYAYATSGYAKDNLGACIYEYFDAGTRRLQEFKDKFKDEGVNELNTICHAHVLTLDVDYEKHLESYCGPHVRDGTLELLFEKDSLGSNISDVLNQQRLLDALNVAPDPEARTLSFAARTGIRTQFDPKIEEIHERVAKLLGAPLTLDPNFDENFQKVQAEKKGRGWEENFGMVVREYLDGFAKQLDWQKFGSDEMMQEGLLEAVEKRQVQLRIVDKLKQSYNECVIEDGILYLQTTPENWGSNTSDAASKLVDML